MDARVVKPDAIELVAGALQAGELTAAAVAAKTGMAYSTVTPKLRALEDAGRAARVKNNGRTFWTLTTTAAPASAAAAGPGTTTSGDTDGHRRIVGPAAEPPARTEAPPTSTDAGAATGSGPAGADPIPEAAAHADTAAQDPSAADPAPVAEQQPDAGTAPATPAAGGTTRRPPGELDRTALAVMRANPDRAYKVGELARLIDQVDAAAGHHYPKASPGAVVLACDRLVDRGDATKVIEQPASYRFAAQPANP